MVWRTACSSSLTSWSHSFDLVAPCPPPSLPLIPQAGITLAVPVLFQEFWSFMNTTWETTQWKTPVTSRRAAAQPFPQPRARPWSSTLPACGRSWAWSPTTRGEERGAPGPAFRYEGFRFFFYKHPTWRNLKFIHLCSVYSQLLQQKQICVSGVQTP